MSSPATTARNIQIEGMSGEACCQKVKTALNGGRDLTTQSVKVGSAAITADQAGSDAACSAIGTAGYKARETDREGVRDTGRQSEESTNAGGTQAGRTGDKAGNQSRAPVPHSASGNTGSTQPMGDGKSSTGVQAKPVTKAM